MVSSIVTLIIWSVIWLVIIAYLRHRAHSNTKHAHETGTSSLTLQIGHWTIWPGWLALTATTNAWSARVLSMASLSTTRKQRLQKWFSIGVNVARIAMFIGIGVLIFSFLSSLPRVLWRIWSRVIGSDVGVAISESEQDSNAMQFAIAIPGLTLPWHQFGFLWIAIFVSVAFHEFGHALAAAAFGVRTVNVGMFIAWLFPGAYVELDDTQLHQVDSDFVHTGSEEQERIAARRVLTVASAGVWHNVVLCVVCGILLVALQPLLLLPLFDCSYHGNQGALVVGVGHEHDFVLASELIPGDTVVTHINGTRIGSVEEWIAQLSDIATSPVDSTTGGYLIRQRHWEKLQHEYGSSCCDETHDDSQKWQCFIARSKLHDQNNVNVCLSVRRELSHHAERCNAEDPKTNGADFCIFPVLPQATGERIVSIHTTRLDLDNTDQEAVAAATIWFRGPPAELYSNVHLGACRPRLLLRQLQQVVPILGIYSWPELLDRVIKYTIVVSASLAILNAAPIHFADGCHIIEAMATLRMWPFVHRQYMRSIGTNLILAIGTLLLAGNLLCTILQAIL
jgi:S2P endopeptidase